MANRHYGEIGDVWKHLPLGAILALERPQEYWESHAGSARYPVEPTPARDYGVGHFAAAAPLAPNLAGSPYTRLLKKSKDDGVLQFYPGSPALAMALLGPDIRRYLFCDTEARSLRDILAAAAAANVPQTKLECLQDDGVSILRGAALLLPDHWTANTLAFLDPYQILEPPLAGSITPVDLFCELTNRGIKTVLWYGFATTPQRQACHAAFAAGIQKYKLSAARHRFGRFEMALQELDTSGRFDPGVGGCGLWCSNLTAAAHEACQQLGPALAALYHDTKLPDGHSGALIFHSQAM